MPEALERTRAEGHPRRGYALSPRPPPRTRDGQAAADGGGDSVLSPTATFSVSAWASRPRLPAHMSRRRGTPPAPDGRGTGPRLTRPVHRRVSGLGGRHRDAQAGSLPATCRDMPGSRACRPRGYVKADAGKAGFREAPERQGEWHPRGPPATGCGGRLRQRLPKAAIWPDRRLADSSPSSSCAAYGGNHAW